MAKWIKNAFIQKRLRAAKQNNESDGNSDITWNEYVNYVLNIMHKEQYAANMTLTSVETTLKLFRLLKSTFNKSKLA